MELSVVLEVVAWVETGVRVPLMIAIDARCVHSLCVVAVAAVALAKGGTCAHCVTH